MGDEGMNGGTKIMLITATSLLAGVGLYEINNYQKKSLKEALDVFGLTLGKKSSK